MPSAKMSGVIARVRQTIRNHRMFEPGQRVAAAVSGGADSVALLLLLVELAPELGISVSVVHVNHGLRGAESDEDEEFVRDLAARLGLAVHAQRVRLPDGENMEQAAREARRRVFAGLAVERVATGHTRSDQAETVLYRVVRGAGTAGLCGILPVTREGVVRPLLDCSRAEIENFLIERGQGWRSDRTNADVAFVRNRIRHELLPVLANDFNPAVETALAATAEVAQAEEDYWRGELDRLDRQVLVPKDGAVLIRVDDLAGLHLAVTRRLVRRALKVVKGDLRGIDLLHVEGVTALAAQAEGHGRLQVPGLDVFRSFEWLRIAKPHTQTRFERDYSFAVTPTETVRTEIALRDSRIFVEILDQVNSSYNAGGDELDRSLLAGPLELRNWHPGDEIQPPGRSRRKIKTLFQEARVPLWERHGWPVLTCGGEIVWTRQFGSAEPFVPRAPGTSVLRVVEVEVNGPADDSRESKQPV